MRALEDRRIRVDFHVDVEPGDAAEFVALLESGGLSWLEGYDRAGETFVLHGVFRSLAELRGAIRHDGLERAIGTARAWLAALERPLVRH